MNAGNREAFSKEAAVAQGRAKNALDLSIGIAGNVHNRRSERRFRSVRSNRQRI
jgi:hypothetical protein